MKIQKSFKNNENTLYIIPTPIGNLEDITIRTLNILKKLDVLYCEDKRVTQKLLNRYEIKVTTKSYHEHNKERANDEMKSDLDQGLVVGLVSDAGMPGISDPGYEIIAELTKNTDYNVVVLPGASAFLVSIIRANFPNNEFKYYGFLGTNKRQKRDKLEQLCYGNETGVFYESPHKLLSTLKELIAISPKVNLTVCRELTKLNEEYITGTAEEIFNHFSINPIKGEFVIVVEPLKKECVEMTLTIEEHFELLTSQGKTKNDAIKQIAKVRNMKKNDVYQLFVD